MRAWVKAVSVAGALALGLSIGGWVVSQRMHRGESLSLWRPKHQSFADLTRSHRAIVEVTVLSAEPKHDETDDIVETFNRVRVDRALAGPLKPGDEFSLRMMGGTDGKHSHPSDPLMPPFVTGTRQLLFLNWYPYEHRPERAGWYSDGGYQSRAEILPNDTLMPIQTRLYNPLAAWSGKDVAGLRQAVSAIVK